MHLCLTLRRAEGPTVATIGNFDGVHRGHQRLILRVIARAREIGAASTVVTFEPQPLEYFRGAVAPPRITRLREKAAALARLGLDQLVVLRFGRIARMAAEEFIEKILVAGLRVMELFVGDDFRFGWRRKGDFQLLQEAGRRFGFRVSRSETITLRGERISSSAIRRALSLGDLRRAEELLGRRYALCGRVVRGDRLGRKLGFPTANLQIGRWPPPLSGVFAVQVEGIADHPWPGVANVGLRPTVGGRRRPVVEVHLFGFEGDLYGRLLEVSFCRKLRDEKRFPSLEALREQIGRDIAEAKALLGRGP